VAVCYVLAGDRLYTPIDGKRKRTSRVEGGRLRRLRDLEANPRIALVVDRWDEDWRNLAWVSVRGRGRALVAAEADHADLAESAGGAKTSDVKTSDDSERRAAIAALRAKYPQYGGGAEGASLADGATVIRIEIEESRWWRSRRSPEEES
jgi:hypothetical protein